MSEKRFEIDVDHLLLVWDTEKNKRLEIEDIVDKLNEQQATIQHLEEEIKTLVTKSAEISMRNVELWEKNAELQRKLDENKSGEK